MAPSIARSARPETSDAGSRPCRPGPASSPPFRRPTPSPCCAAPVRRGYTTTRIRSSRTAATVQQRWSVKPVRPRCCAASPAMVGRPPHRRWARRWAMPQQQARRCCADRWGPTRRCSPWRRPPRSAACRNRRHRTLTGRRERCPARPRSSFAGQFKALRQALVPRTQPDSAIGPSISALPTIAQPAVGRSRGRAQLPSTSAVTMGPIDARPAGQKVLRRRSSLSSAGAKPVRAEMGTPAAGQRVGFGSGVAAATAEPDGLRLRRPDDSKRPQSGMAHRSSGGPRRWSVPCRSAALSPAARQRQGRPPSLLAPACWDATSCPSPPTQSFVVHRWAGTGSQLPRTGPPQRCMAAATAGRRLPPRCHPPRTPRGAFPWLTQGWIRPRRWSGSPRPRRCGKRHPRAHRQPRLMAPDPTEAPGRHRVPGRAGRARRPWCGAGPPGRVRLRPTRPEPPVPPVSPSAVWLAWSARRAGRRFRGGASRSRLIDAKRGRVPSAWSCLWRCFALRQRWRATQVDGALRIVATGAAKRRRRSDVGAGPIVVKPIAGPDGPDRFVTGERRRTSAHHRAARRGRLAVGDPRRAGHRRVGTPGHALRWDVLRRGCTMATT